jgi:uncharacterized protein YjbJ (UPF0337 family)
MNDDELKGKVENAKGRVKEAAGAITGNKKTQAEGMGERFKGAVREKVGEIKGDVAREADKRNAGSRPVDETDDE